MGDFLDNMTGSNQADAAENAANLQYESARAARKQQGRFLGRMRRDFAPYLRFGTNQLPGLNRLINNPQAQLDFIQNNPFFNALADDATNRLLNIQAASGRLGTGDTPAALQNQLLLMGNDLLQQGIGNRMNAATMGQNAAGMTGNAMMNVGNNISELITQQGNALAAGQIGGANARGAGAQNIANMAMNGILLSDIRFKTDIEVIGRLDCGIPVCSFRYVFNPQVMIGVMAQDVEKVIPGAVLEVFGVKYVDYDELERVLH